MADCIFFYTHWERQCYTRLRFSPQVGSRNGSCNEKIVLPIFASIVIDFISTVVHPKGIARAYVLVESTMGRICQLQ